MGNKKSDMHMIAQTVVMYCDGMYHGDIEKLKKAFHPDACIIGYFQGDLLYDSRDEFLEFVTGLPAPASTGDKYEKQIVSMDVTETIATAKITEFYLGLHFTDYMSLVKVDGDWLIVNKTFHYDPPE